MNKQVGKPGYIRRKVLKYEGRIFSVYNEDIKTPDNLIVNRDVVEHRNAVAILAKYKGRYILTHEYRAGVNKETYGIPAGLIEPHEDPVNAGIRELKEETGLISTQGKILTTLTSSEGFTDEHTTLIYLHVDYDSKNTHFDKDELVHHEFVSKIDLFTLWQLGLMKSYPGVVATLMLQNNQI